MRTFDIVRSSEVEQTYRVQKIKTDFDYSVSEVSERFTGAIDLSKPWKIGLIVGSSGTGKTTIARDLFGSDIVNQGGGLYTHKSVIDDMPKEADFESITRMFYSVGFGSVPSWLKPYSVLSNGEKMRVDLARALLEKDLVCFDEFTSVVDRDVARTMCKAIHKTMSRAEGKRFIAVSCHRDVVEFLAPDWVFDTDVMRFSFMSAHPPRSASASDIAEEASGRDLSVITI